MARISIRVFVDDAELDRAEAELPAEVARDIVDACKRTLDEHTPPTPEEEMEAAEAFARFLDRPRKTPEEIQQSLERRTRAEEANAERLLRKRGWKLEKPA